MTTRFAPSPSQHAAITSPAGPALVLAGPGAGKTFCLIERIRFLITELGFEPKRICAFTFTNKAAEEIAHRLEREIGEHGAYVKRGTIHAFCAELLRELGPVVGVRQGFGIADEDYQRAVLSRVGVPARWHTNLLNRLTLHRFRGVPLDSRDEPFLRRYELYLERRNVLDFDSLILKTAALLESTVGQQQLLDRWDYILVDEFQDLNPTQYDIVRLLASRHNHLFAVGDDEQSIYSWAGADPKVFRQFANDFGVVREYALEENRRCPKVVVDYARRLMTHNPSIFDKEKVVTADRASEFPVRALHFSDDDAEMAWLLQDLARDRAASGLSWGDYAVLYRRHRVGGALESAFLKSGIPCRLAHGRALADDPVVKYLIAALRVISAPTDRIHEEGFLRVVLPRALYADVRAKAEERGEAVMVEMGRMARDLPKQHADGQKLRRAFYALRNLPALAARHTALQPLIEELLSHRVGEFRTVLDDRHDEISDPADHAEVRALAERIERALAAGRPVQFEGPPGLAIPLRGMVSAAGMRRLLLDRPHAEGPDLVTPADAPTLGLALTLFKALQLLSAKDFVNAFRDFTAIDLETTGKDTTTAEIVEIAAVRVRDGKVEETFHRLVKPRVPIHPGAAAVHHITEAEVADAPYFEEVWPAFAAFCGSDVLVAHNGYDYDFPILRRMIKPLGGGPLCTYDTLLLARDLHPGSRKLTDLAHVFGIDAGQAHRALDDTLTLSHVFLKLGDLKIVRTRKTALVSALDHLGVALALSPERNEEADKFRDMTRVFALGKYSECLDYYSAERERLRLESPDQEAAAAIPPVEVVIDTLGGEDLMLRLRAQKSAEQRYPEAMARLRRLLDRDGAPTISLAEHMTEFLQRVVLSKWDGTEADADRVNLLTLHSTKGLEFSRVYVIGVSDTDMIVGAPNKWSPEDINEARRLLYVGMTRTIDRLVLTHADNRGGKPAGAQVFLDNMQLALTQP